MKNSIRNLLIGSISLALCIQISEAQNGTWTNAAGGSWAVQDNWTNNVIAEGAGNAADFSTLDLTGNTTVTLDSAPTIGGLYFGDTTPSANWILSAGSGGPLTLDVLTAWPFITVNNQTATFGTELAGTKGFAKNGSGYLELTTANTITGPVVVNGGALKLIGGGSLLNNPEGILVYGTGSKAAGLPGYGPQTRLGALYLTGDLTVMDRLGTTAVTNRGGEIVYFRGSGNPEPYIIGKVTAEPGMIAIGSAPAAGATLQVTDFYRNKGASAEFRSYYGGLGTSGDAGRITLGNINDTPVANDAGGLLGGWAIAYNGDGAPWDSYWATYDPTTGVKPYAGTYIGGILASTSPTDNVKHNGSAETITASTTINSLISLNGDQIINNATITINSGGLIVGYANHWIKTAGGGKITSGLGSGELFAHVYDGPYDLNRDWQINGVEIVDNGATAVSLIKSGDGALKLNATNTYSGGTYVNAGILRIFRTGNNSASALPPGKPVFVNPGGILRLDVNDGMGYYTGNPSMVTINRGRVTTAASRHQSVGNFTLEAGTIASEGTGDGQNYIFDGTITTLPADASSVITVHQAVNLRGGSGSGPVTFNVAEGAAAADLLVSGVLANGGGNRLIKNGEGTMQLTAACTYGGETTINQGTLALSGAGNLASANIVVAAAAKFDVSTTSTGFTLLSGKTLQGYGTVIGPVAVASGGTITTGPSIGNLTFMTPPTLQGTVALKINKSGSTFTSDKLVVNGALTYDGTLQVTATGDALVEGDTFDLFDATEFNPSSFTSLNLPTALPPGMVWDISQLTVDGTIKVAKSGPIVVINGPNAFPSRVVYPGGTITLSVTVAGEEPITYQWRKNGTDIEGATEPTLTVPNMTLEDAGSYDVVLNNSYGPVPSAAIALGVLDPKGLFIQELFDGSSLNVSIAGQGANLTSSRGFKTGGTWAVNAGNTIYSANNFNLVSGSPDTLPGLPPQATGLGGLWVSGSDWGRDRWATRELDPANPIIFGSDREVYFSVRLNNTGDTAVGIGFASGSTPASAFLGVGAHWNGHTGLDGQADANSLYISDGLLNQDLDGNNDGPYAMRVHTTPGTMNGKALIVGKLTLSQYGDDVIQIKQYNPGTMIDNNLDTLVWDLSYAVTDPNVMNMLGTHLLIWMNGSGNGELDAIRVGTTWYDVTGVQIISGPPVIYAGPTASPSDHIYMGQDATLSVTANGAPTLTYQWRKNGQDIDGATSDSYAITGATTDNDGSYDVVVSNGTGSVTSAVVVLTVTDSQPIITAQPSPANLVRWEHASVTYTVTAEGTMPLSYQWKHNGEDIVGETSATLTLSDLQVADGGSYSVRVSNVTGDTDSDAVTLTVLQATPSSFAQLILGNSPISYWKMDEATGTIGYDSVGNNNVTHSGVVVGVEGPRPEAWLGFGSDNLAAQYDGANAYSLGPVGLMNNRPAFTLVGWFNSAQRTPSGRGLVGQNDALEFGFQGTNTIQLWTPGGGVVNADVTGLVEDGQWYFLAAVGNGTDIRIYLDGNLIATGGNPTANYGSSSYGFNIGGNVFGGGTGAPSNGFGWIGALDDIALFGHALTAQQITDLFMAGKYSDQLPPSVTHEPVSISRYIGGTAQFQVGASGGVPLSYQWRKDEVDLTEATGPVLTMLNVSEANAGSYSVVISNASGMVTSAVATLTVLLPVPGTYAEAIVTNHAIAFWQLDESNGSAIAYDYMAGNNANHTAVNAGVTGPQPPDWKGFANDNLAAEYDGTSSYSLGPVGLMNNRPAFTLAGWFKSTARTERHGLFGQNDAVEFAFNSPTNIHLWTPGGGYVNANITDLVVDEQWYFVAGVANGTDIRIYLNGNLVGTGGTPTNNYGSSSYSFNIGGNVLGVGTGAPNNGYGWNGVIDGVALFDRALSPEEVQNLFAMGQIGAGTPPEITQQPAGATVLAGGQVTLSVSATGTPGPEFQWFKGANPIEGATGNTLAIGPVTGDDTGDYSVIVTNAAGGITSDTAHVEVIAPVAGSYAYAVAANGPVAYWPLNETMLGTVYDLWAGHNGLHGSELSIALPGPQPPAFPGFAADNYSVYSTYTDFSWVTAPALNLNSDTVTITCWIYRDAFADQDPGAGLVLNETAGNVAGLHFGVWNDLHYTWNNNSATTDWESGLIPPPGEWTFVALVIEPTQAVIYMSSGETVVSATNVVAHTPEAFDGITYLGGLAGHLYNGGLDEVSIFNRALSPAEIMGLFQPVQDKPELSIEASGTSYILNWEGEAQLQAAAEVGGTYETIHTGTGPYTDTPEPGKARRFYRLFVP